MQILSILTNTGLPTVLFLVIVLILWVWLGKPKQKDPERKALLRTREQLQNAHNALIFGERYTNKLPTTYENERTKRMVVNAQEEISQALTHIEIRLGIQTPVLGDTLDTGIRPEFPDFLET